MAASILTDLAIRLHAKTAELNKGLTRAKGQIRDFKSNAKKGTKEIRKGFQDMGNGARQSLGLMTSQFGMMGTVLTRAIGGIKGLTLGLKGMKGVLISTGIGAIFVAIGTAVAALMTYFKGTVDGARKFAAITGTLKGVMTALKEILINVGRFLVKMFEDPKQAISDLWDAIKNNLVNRFQGMLTFFKSGWSAIANGAKGVGAAVAGIFNKDKKDQAHEYFLQMQKDMVETGKAAVQLATGIDVEKNLGKIRNEFENITETGKKAAALEQRKHDLYAANTKFLIREAELVEEIARLTDISSDKELEIAESLKGTLDAIAVTKDLYAGRISLAEEALRIQEAEMALGSNSLEDERKRAELQVELNKLRKEEYDKIRELKNRKEEIDARANAIEVKREAEKQAKLKAERDKAAAEEKARLDSIEAYRVQVLGQSLEGQIALLTEAYDARRIADKEYWSEYERLRNEITERDKAAAEEEKQRALDTWNAKIQKAAEYVDSVGYGIDILGQIFEAQKQKELKAAGDNAKKKEEIERKYARKQKGIAIGQAIIGAALAVVNALGTKPFIPMGLIAAGLATAAGGAQIATIASTPLAKGGIAYSPTNALIGEYTGAANNPEIVAPLNKLQDLLFRGNKGGGGGLSGNVVFEIGYDKLIGILRKAETYANSY
jgi:hypothetical protein